LINSAPPTDPDWTDKLEKERQDEIQVIGGACEALGREIYEVSPLLETHDGFAIDDRVHRTDV
jgi:hypothetical protein